MSTETLQMKIAEFRKNIRVSRCFDPEIEQEKPMEQDKEEPAEVPKRVKIF